jgi:hypothetical protein
MNLAVNHDKCQIDYSYSFNSIRYSVLDHFLLPGTLYSRSVDRVTVLHDIDNMSDHEPIVLDLNMNIHCVGFQDNELHTSSVVGESHGQQFMQLLCHLKCALE